MASSSSSSSAIDYREQAYNAPPHQYNGYGYGGNPLARTDTASTRVQAFGGAAQPGTYKPPLPGTANPAPLGLAGFALTTFVLSLVNLGTCGLSNASIVVAPAYAYGGLIQLLAGMWEIALGNVFGGTALSSYGGFWIGLGIILTPVGFDIEGSYATAGAFYGAFSFYLYGWFLYTFLLWLCTLKSTVAFSSLFLAVWLTFLLLATSYLEADNNGGAPNVALTRAGGATGIVAAFLAWWNMLAGLANPSNSFFLIPVLHFPWSEKGRESRRARKVEAEGHEV
ncbi:hypothetical protein LTR36_006029 [Oleoguttula mirabilis]|uniref:Uncharacterized protein n=1 Tax=Oleoguttula mirabilis TaxID=1507867 RepID=A0AAV9JCQ6_9PEZI|nr:hypothetical protein LTR36_006029 [Oleoguttula mirabilis]